MKYQNSSKRILIILLVLVVCNVGASYMYLRWDLTEDQRFTLSDPSRKSIARLDKTVYIDVLLAGDLTAEFLRLQREIRLLLEQYAQINSGIEVSFLNPLEDPTNREGVIAELQKLGLRPAQISVEEGGKISQELIFPWAMVNVGDRSEKVQLLRSQPGASQQERINASIENLEFAFSDAFSKLGIDQKKSVAVLKGNGELEDRYLADYLTELQGYYRLAPFTLDSVAISPEMTLQQLQAYDAAIIAKPTQAFSDEEKLILDQYIISGGKTLWMVDAVGMELDSLKNNTGESVALWRDLNLDDLLFRYGIRLNAQLVSDLICAPIVLASGNGRESQYNPLPWVYYPIALSKGNHPITNNLEPVLMRFAGSIDTLKNNYRKTILYSSSEISRAEGVPTIISLMQVNETPNADDFKPGNLPLAVLVEGKFTSAYKNRQKAVSLKNYKETGGENKMIVISDGDVISNQLKEGKPLELGYDQWTNAFYGNKEFLINCINYLLEDNGLINIRNKQVKVPLLDTNRIGLERNYWQLMNIGLPAILLAIFGGVFQWLRKRKFT